MKNFYTSVNNFMWSHPFIKSCTHFISRFCPYMVAIFYMLFLLKIYLDRPNNLLILAAEPIGVISITLLLRIITNRKRPSEKYNLNPIDGSKKTGHSFPSIHVAASLSITLAVLRYGPNMGLLLFSLTISIIFARLLSGVHYITDIVASIAIAFIINLI